MESQFNEIENRNDWDHMYMEIRDETDKRDSKYTYADAKKKENKFLNRYRDVVPYDHSRIKLTRGIGDYINANLIPVEEANRKYILTQGPLPQTVDHFWAMVWEQKSKAVLMLNGLIERGCIKCHQYWPEKLNDEQVLEDVDLSIKLVLEDEKEHFVVRKIILTDLLTHESREILQFHYTSWPDFGLPESPNSFLEFLLAVRQSGSLNLQNHGPAIVHCSAGIGRSGTFCLVDSCLVLIEKKGASANVDVKKILLDMRHYRMGLIQTPEQLRFSYMAIIEGIKTIINTHSNNGTTTTTSTTNVTDEVKLNNLNDTQSVDPTCDLYTNNISNISTSENETTNSSIVNNSSLNSLGETETRKRSNLSTSIDNSTVLSNGTISPEEAEKRRLRNERNQKTLDQIKRMKEKQKQVEARNRLKDKLIKFGSWGLAAVLLGIVLFTRQNN